jgi:WD40 repeat protein
VSLVAFGPNGRTLTTVDERGAIQLWDVAARRRLGEPLMRQRNVRSIAFSQDGRRLVTAGTEPTLLLWDASLWATDPARFAARLCPIVRRNMTASEWSELRPHAAYRSTCAGW